MNPECKKSQLLAIRMQNAAKHWNGSQMGAEWIINQHPTRNWCGDMAAWRRTNGILQYIFANKKTALVWSSCLFMFVTWSVPYKISFTMKPPLGYSEKTRQNLCCTSTAIFGGYLSLFVLLFNTFLLLYVSRTTYQTPILKLLIPLSNESS